MAEEKPDEEEVEEGDKLIPDEILEGIPEEDRTNIQRTFSMFGRFPMQNPLSQKVTTEHITAIISNGQRQDKRESDNSRIKLLFILIIVIISVVFIGYLLNSFKDDKEVLIPLLTGIISFLGGLGLGKSL